MTRSIDGIKRFHPYLSGQKFTVHTDHNALKWLMSIQDPSGRLARWSMLIQNFDFDIIHRPGKANGNADALSRRPYGTCTINALDSPGVQARRIFEYQRRDPDLTDMIDYLEQDQLNRALRRPIPPRAGPIVVSSRHIRDENRQRMLYTTRDSQRTPV